MTTTTSPPATTPDPTSPTDDADTPLWSITERWVMTDGADVDRIVDVADHEPRKGDLMPYAYRAGARLAEAKRDDMPITMHTDLGLFVTMYDKVRGVFIDVTDNDGAPVQPEPGLVDRDGPVLRDDNGYPIDPVD